MEQKKEGIFLYRNWISLLREGKVTAEQFKQLVLLMDDARFNGVYADEKDIEDPIVSVMWNTIKFSVRKSERNALDYRRRKEIESNSNKQQKDNKITTCNIVDEECDRDYIETVRKEFPTELSFILRTLNDQEKRDERNEKLKTINYKLSATDQEKKEFKDFLTKYREKLLEEENKQQIYSELGVERRDEQPIEFQTPSLKKVGHITTLSKYDQVIKDNYTAYDTLKNKYGTEDSLLIESIVNRILRSLDSEEDKNRFRGELEAFKEKNTKAAE